MKPRLFLIFITNAGNEENLRELIEPIKEHLDGIVAVFHHPKDSGADYLESVKGAGKVIYRDWVNRFDYSLNECLFAGIIEEGDIVVKTDVLERPAAPFVSIIKDTIHPGMISQGLDCLYYYGKDYVYIYNELMQYQGSPHTGLRGTKKAIEISSHYPNEADVRLNVRPLKRTDPLNWVAHYLKYYLYPAGSNQCLLGLEKQGDPAKLFGPREERRLAFRREMRRRGFPMTVDGAKAILAAPLDHVMKGFINGDKIVNDSYRLFVLKDETVVDTHLPKDMKLID